MTEKILIIQTAFLGDAVLTLPMIKKLKEIYPESIIDVVSIPSTKEIFDASPFVDNTIVLDKKNKHKSLLSLRKFVKNIKSKKYTRLYSPHRSFRTALIVLGSNIRETTGFNISSAKHVYKNLIEYNPEHHEVQRNFDLIGFDYSGNGWRILPEVGIAEDIKEKVDIFFRTNYLNENNIAVAPGTVWNTKKYPENYFIDVIKHFAGQGKNVILIGGQSDKELCDRIAAGFESRVISSAGEFSLTGTIEILKRVDLLLCNDSAPTHLGMCADIPVLTLYCSTVPSFGFAPYNEKSEFLSYDKLDCKPCGIHGYKKCPIGTFECGFNLTPQTVISKINEIMNND